MINRKSIIIGINLGDFGSTGVIMRNALEFASAHGDFDYLAIVPRDAGKPNTFAYLNQNNIFDKIDRRFFHKSLRNPDGLFEYRATKRIIKKIEEKCRLYENVLIHLHNIHMASIDFRILFGYLSKQKRIKKVFYTIHDEWPYSGACYVHMNNGPLFCDKWQSGCQGICLQKYGTEKYPVSKIWDLKQEFSLLLKRKMMLLPVSNWINGELSRSFLKDFDRKVINGETGIVDLGHKDKELINQLSLNNKKIVLTISGYWNEWKGAKYIYEIAEKLPSDYVMLVVGGKFDTKAFKNLIHLGDVPNEKLNHFYSIADVYLSTSQTESLGLTTCEAQICGIPVVAFGHAGVKETFIDGETGILVGEDNDVGKMVSAITKIVESKPFKREDIIKNGSNFAKYSSSKKYFDLYSKCLTED